MRTFLFAIYLVAIITDSAPVPSGCSCQRDDVPYHRPDSGIPRIPGAVDRETDPAVEMDTDTLAAADPSLGAGTTSTVQGPIEVRILNTTGHPFYLDLSRGNNSALSCHRNDGIDCDLFSPICMRDCEEMPVQCNSPICTLMPDAGDVPCETSTCDAFPQVRLVDAAHPYTLRLDGFVRRENIVTHCPHGILCFERIPMSPGNAYVFHLHTWESYSCLADSCPINDDSTISFASPIDPEKTYEIPFQPPSNDALEIEIAD